MRPRALVTFVFLVTLGSMQMLADVLALPRLKALFAATQVAPAMKVFTSQQGYETHAARFVLGWQEVSGEARSLELTPKVYRNLHGPYNRRNVYGAALASGPLLREDARLRGMQQSVMQYAFCSPGKVRAELGIPADARHLSIHVLPTRPLARADLDFSWEVSCNE
jgi:hypothetical protein